MQKRIISAVGGNEICKILREKGYEMPEDIPYMEGAIEVIKREFSDVLIVSSELEGEMDKYIFIEKIQEIDSKIKIIVIAFDENENYKKFLYSKGIFDILFDGKSSVDKLMKCIEGENNADERKCVLRRENLNMNKITGKENKNVLKTNLATKFQKQQIITFAGIGSSGKTTIATQFATILAKTGRAKVLIIDFDTLNSSVNMFLGVKRMPKNPEYILPPDKNSGLNYMLEAIDKRILDADLFEKYVVKSKQFSNLDILTGNKSLFICKNVINTEYYSRILEKAKELYDFIIIDTPGNIFMDSMQFSLINATKIYFITEATYLSLERTHRIFDEIFPNWGISEKKVSLIINKYHKKSLDKNIVKEIMKGTCISGYINFSEKYDEAADMGIPYVLEREEEYIPFMEEFDMIPKMSFRDKLISIKSAILQALMSKGGRR